jgi:type VI secretion system protein ImpJ
VDEQQKVLWSEGAFLVPQHFQQADRYHEGQLRRRARGLCAFDWGVTELKIDPEALQGGELLLKRCAAVLPDGLQVTIPDLDEAPAGRPIAPAFDLKRETLGVFLACAEERPGRPVFHGAGGGEGTPLRFRPGLVTLADADARGREREIVVGRRNVKVLFEGEATEAVVTLKIAELVRTETGAFALSPKCIPPLLYIGASEPLSGLLRRLIEILNKKSEDLSAWRRQRAPGLIEFTTSEASRFWFLHTVNSALPPLMHALYQPRSHPEELYVEMGRLFGSLSTFADQGAPKDVPRYDHGDLTTTFGYLEEWIRYFVGTAIPDLVVPVQLFKTV